jgi:hypothetical protein
MPKNKIISLSYLGMEILTTSTSSQSLKIVPRKDVSSPTFILKDKSTRTESTITVTKTTDGDYMVLSAVFSLKEGSQYSFKVKDGLEEIYRGLIFCTDQTNLDNYSVNKDEYVSESTYNNDFVII